MKKCSHCKKEQVSANFGLNKRNKDGLSYYCFSCARNRMREKGYNSKEKAKKWSDKNIEKRRAINLRNHKKYPDKYKARQMVFYAVKQGFIKKPEHCEYNVWPLTKPCQETKLEAHHWNGYSQSAWFTVEWLCHKHHMINHRKS